MSTPTDSDTEMHSRHVCFFPGELQLGGVGRNTLNLVEELLKRGVRVDLFLSRRAGVYIPQIPAGTRVFDGGGSVKRSLLPLVRYLRKERPDLLVSARPYINLVAVMAKHLAMTNTKVVVTERTTQTTDQRSFEGVREPLIRLGCRLLYPTADHVVAVSQAVADEMIQKLGLDAGDVEVIYNPVVTHKIQELCEETVDDPWLSASPAPIVLGVGRLATQKDFPTLMRAFAEVRREVNARLLILGEGEDRKDLEELARELDIQSHVRLPGYVENPFAYMARATVFVLSSRWEGLPTALIEALATGVPVVSTDCPGGSREILADGSFGHLVPVGDTDHLAQAIRVALTEPPTPARLKARANDFSAGKAAERYLSLIGS